MRRDKKNSPIRRDCIKHIASPGVRLIREMEDCLYKNYFKKNKNTR